MNVFHPRCRLLSVVTAQYHTPKDGFVPDSITAVKIAEAVLVRVREGKNRIRVALQAALENGVWTVDGTLHCPDGKGGVTATCDGGTAEVKLSKTDGRILRVIHYE